MQEKDFQKTQYLVIVKVLEARDLKGESSGVNPYVKVTCGNLDPQQTKTIEKSANAIWDQSFTFSGLLMNKWELETFELNFEVHDQHPWWSNSLVGSYSIGISTMYRNPGGELYKKWLRLSKPDQPTSGVGFLQVSCFIVGPGQEPPVHEDGDMEGDVDAEQEQMLRDGVSPDVIFEKQKEKQGLWLVNAPSQNYIKYELLIKIYGGEHLARLEDEETKPSAFISVRSQGVSRSTRVVSYNDKPNWAQRIHIPVFTPTWNDKIKVVCWHQDGEYLPTDVFMANVPEQPSPLDAMNITMLQTKGGRMEPTWFNMYGVRPKEWRSGMSRLHASAFMGRVLMSLHLIANDRPVLATSSGQGTTATDSKTYLLWLDAFELVNCDDLIKEQTRLMKVTVQAHLNGSSTQKGKGRTDGDTSTLKFENGQLKPVEVALPVDPSQIPDLFININLTTYAEKDRSQKPQKKQEEEDEIENNDRIGFVRLACKDLVVTSASDTSKSKPSWQVVRSIVNRKKNVGRLLVNARLIPKELKKVQRGALQDSKDVPYWFFPQIFSGYELAPNIPDVGLVTFLKLNIGAAPREKKSGGNQQKDNQPKSQIKLAPAKGRFPTFGGSGYIKKPYKVLLNEEAAFAKDMRVQLFLQQSGAFAGSSQVMLGSFLVPIISMVGTLYKRPQYYSIVDTDGNCQGKILARFFLMKRDQHGNEEKQKEQIFNYMQRIIQEVHTADIKVSIIGIRQLLRLTNDAELMIFLTNSQRDHGITAQSAYTQAQKLNQKKGDSESDDEDDEAKKRREKEGEVIKWHKKGQYFQVKMMKAADDKPTYNPNFGRSLTFEKVKLKRDLLLWPNLVIKVFERGIDSPESHHLVLPTFIFADFLIEANEKLLTDVKISLALLMNTASDEAQTQDNPLMFYKDMMHAQLLSMSDDLQERFCLKLPQTRDEVFTQLLNKPADHFDELDEVRDLFAFEDEQQIELDQPDAFDALADETRPKAIGGGGKEGGNDGNKAKGKGAEQNQQLDSEESEGFEDDEFTEIGDLWQRFIVQGTIKGDSGATKIVKKKAAADEDDEEALMADIDDGINPDEDDPVQPHFKLETVCSESDKKREITQKESRSKDMRLLLDKLRKIQDSLDKGQADFKEQIRFQMMNARQRIEGLEAAMMDTELFEAHLQKDEEEKFDYGDRPRSRKPLEGELNENLPYLSLNLLQNDFGMLSTTENFCNNNYIWSTGKPVAARINLLVSVQRVKGSQAREGGVGNESGRSNGSAQSEAMELSSDEGDTPFERLSVHPHGFNVDGGKGSDLLLFRSIEEVDAQTEKEEDLSKPFRERQEQADRLIQLIESAGYKLDMFRQDTLERMTASKDYTMRLFVKGAQNLAAVDNKVRAVRNQLAGDLALSSADPYLVVRIMNEEQRSVHDGYDTVIEESLDPQFFVQKDEPGLSLQEDWRLEVEIRDQAMLRMNDTVIGMTMIDLEQRRWSNKYALTKLILEQEESRTKEQIEDHKKASSQLRKKDQAEKDLIKKIDVYLREKQHRFKQMKDGFAKKPVPQAKVEHRPLKQLGKEGAPQGVVELFVDVLDNDETRITEPQKLQQVMDNEQFEVRLIIWETREVPAPNGSVMSAQIRASYERTGLSEDPEIKETDVHAGCKTGRAVFNWRMKFIIGNDQFPRLKLQIFDTGLAGAEAIGETVINLSTSIKLLKKVGTLEDKKIWVEFANPQKPDSPSGYCLIQLQIKTSEEAENDPVGEAQDEPNHDPVLKRPTEGRGWGDTLAGLGLGLPDIALPDFFGLIKKVIAAVMGAMAIFFVMFLILASK